MSKITTNEGITIEAREDTLYISGIPSDEKYAYGLYSIKFSFEEGNFPAGTWKKITDGTSSYCLKDRGVGKHKVFISFAPEIKGYPDYTVKYVYGVEIREDDSVEFGD